MYKSCTRVLSVKFVTSSRPCTLTWGFKPVMSGSQWPKSIESQCQSVQERDLQNRNSRFLQQVCVSTRELVLKGSQPSFRITSAASYLLNSSSGCVIISNSQFPKMNHVSFVIFPFHWIRAWPKLHDILSNMHQTNRWEVLLHLLLNACRRNLFPTTW